MKTGDVIKSLNSKSKAFSAAWKSYCELYGEGYSDPAEFDESFVIEFVDYAAGLLDADLKKAAEGGGEGDEAAAQTAEESPAATAAKRPAESEAPKGSAAPAEKKKLTMKKAVADEIRRLNSVGGLLQVIRPGAVAGALARMEEPAALKALLALEEQANLIDDPNQFLCDYAA